jgi:hypothetical protein
MRRGAGTRCFGFLSEDGRFAHCTRDEGNGRLPLEAGGTYPHFLAGECRCGSRHGSVSPITPRPQPPANTSMRSSVDVGRLWNSFSDHDDRGEAYLRGRNLWPAPHGSVRFNVGRSGDWWLDAKSALGYRVAVAMRDSGGVLRSLALRFCGPGDPPNGLKVLNLLGASSKGALFSLSSFWTAAQSDDPVFLSEGMTDFLAAARLTDALAEERGEGVPWPFGVPGVGTAEDAIESFAPVFRGRRVFLALDTDEQGKAGTERAADAARKVGADPWLYPFPEGVKDLTELLGRWEGAA